MWKTENLFNLKALEQRMDTSRGGTRDFLLYANACLVRSRVLTVDELTRPSRFRPAVLLAGASWSKKTFTVHLTEEILNRPYANEEDLVAAFRETLQLERYIPDTTRPRRTLKGSYFQEKQGDPYRFFDQEPLALLLRHWLEADRQLGCSAKTDQAQLRRYLQWSYFISDLYAFSRWRIWLAARQPNSALLFEGALDQMQVLWGLFPNSDLVYARSKFFRDLHSENEELEKSLKDNRPNQGADEQEIRRHAGILMTGYVSSYSSGRSQEERLPASHLFSIAEGKERILARNILRLLLNQQAQERQLMVQDVISFLEENKDRIEKFAFSGEIEQEQRRQNRPLMGLPGFLSPLLPPGSYYFSSPFTTYLGEEPTPPIPERFR